MIKARDYQGKIHTDIEAGWGEFSRQLVVEPTGCGKTVQFALQVAERIKEGKLKIVAGYYDLATGRVSLLD